jgi:aryl-alcohol dehydrogenase-like predicted oxidoreductase
VTVSGTSQGETIRTALALGLFDAVQATWNLHERSAEAALEAAHEQGLTVYVKEALANGRLAGRAAAPALAELAAREGTTPDALALAAVLARPWAGVVLSGAASLETLRSNLAAAELRPSADTIRALDALVEDPEAYWRRRSELPWT